MHLILNVLVFKIPSHIVHSFAVILVLPSNQENIGQKLGSAKFNPEYLGILRKMLATTRAIKLSQQLRILARNWGQKFHCSDEVDLD